MKRHTVLVKPNESVPVFFIICVLDVSYSDWIR